MSAEKFPAAHIALAFELKGELRVDLLQQAFQQVWAGADLGRFRFDVEAGSQWLASPLPLPFEQAQVREAEVKALLTKDFNLPFNLREEAPLRLRLLQTKPGRSVLGIVAHHLALDGWSIARLLEKACLAYNALLKGEALPALPWQSYWKFQEEYLAQLAQTEESKKFWRGQKFSAAPLLAPYEEKTKGHRVIYILNKKFYLKIKDLAKANRVTPFLLLLHACSLALGKVLKKNEFLLAVPIANRDGDNAEFVIGNCANLLPFELRITDDGSADLARLRDAYLDALPHALVPVQEIQKYHRADLTQVHFNFEPSVEEPELAGVELDFFPFPVNQVEKPIIINVNDTKKTYYLEIDYQSQALEFIQALTIFTETEQVINRLSARHTPKP